jgi:hypothetical protein
MLKHCPYVQENETAGYEVWFFRGKIKDVWFLGEKNTFENNFFILNYNFFIIIRSLWCVNIKDKFKKYIYYFNIFSR